MDEEFYDDESPTHVTIPDGVTGIGDKVFYGCTSLTNVIIPASVTSIRNWAFKRCFRLTSVEILGRKAMFGTGVFEYCTKLKTINANIRFTKEKLGAGISECVIITDDPKNIPTDFQAVSIIKYAKAPAEKGSEKEKAYLAFMKEKAKALADAAVRNMPLLRIMTGNGLIDPEMTGIYLATAREAGATKAEALLLGYCRNN